jgi:hypothetical protein
MGNDPKDLVDPKDVEITKYAPLVGGLQSALAAVDAREAMFKRVAEVAIQATHPTQWTDLGGKPWPTGPAAETIARRFAVSMTDIRRERFPLSDEHGEYALWVYTATFSLPGGSDVMDAEGTCSSRDSFLGLDVQEDSYDEGNIMKAALTNCRTNGIMQILGLRGMPWERLEQLGLDRSLAAKVEFRKGGKGGGSKAQVPPSERTIPYGQSKGKKLSEVEEKDLKWLREAMSASVLDPEKARWKADNESWVTAIDAEFARRANVKAGVTTNGNGNGSSIWPRVRALDPTIPETDLKALVKRVTGKASAKELTDADFPKISKEIADIKGPGNDDIPF